MLTAFHPCFFIDKIELFDLILRLTAEHSHRKISFAILCNLLNNQRFAEQVKHNPDILLIFQENMNDFTAALLSFIILANKQQLQENIKKINFDNMIMVFNATLVSTEFEGLIWDFNDFLLQYRQLVENLPSSKQYLCESGNLLHLLLKASWKILSGSNDIANYETLMINIFQIFSACAFSQDSMSYFFNFFHQNHGDFLNLFNYVRTNSKSDQVKLASFKFEEQLTLFFRT